MITFVYCCICLLIVCCQTTRTQNEDDYTNDFPPNTKPKMEIFRQKIGTDILMHCSNHHKNNITWDFKHCGSNYYKGIQCDKKNMYRLDSTDDKWQRLDFDKKYKNKLELKNVTKKDIGVYRCLYNDSIIKIYVVDVVLSATPNESPPQVFPLITSPNSTMLPHSLLVIQCKITSIVPPEVRWFRECREQRCVRNFSDIQSSGCYCLIPNSNFVYSNVSGDYFSKLSINNLRHGDSGMYICLALSPQGIGYNNITIKVQDPSFLVGSEEPQRFSFSLLFLIPLCFILVPVTIWLCFYRRKKKNRSLSEQQKQLIKVDIACRS